jgi:hypothetical protein
MKRPQILIALVVCLLLILWKQKEQAPSDGPQPAAQPVAIPAEQTTSANPSPAIPTAPNSTNASTTSLPVPKTAAELNALADGPLPLASKIEVLSKLMHHGTPAEAKAVAVRSVFIVKNGQYKETLLPLLLDSSLKPEAMIVLGMNLHERPLEVMIPSWIALRDQPNHPLHEEASDAVRFHLKEKADLTGPALAEAAREYLTPAKTVSAAP